MKSKTLEQHLNKALEATKHGQINWRLKVYNGEPVYYIEDNELSRNYKDAGTPQAIEEFIGIVKSQTEGKLSGTLSVTFNMHEGKTNSAYISIQRKRYISE